MKLSSLLIVGMLVAALVVMAAPSAKADSVSDPRIILNSCNCDATPFNGESPLTIAYAQGEILSTFEYDPGDGDPADLTSLEVDLTDVPNVLNLSFSCFSNTFIYCSVGLEDINLEDGTATVRYFFDDQGFPGSPVASGPCEANGSAGGFCQGFISSIPGLNTFTADIETPEPSSLLLLIVGLVPIIGLSRKRWGVAHSA